jgi:hypothetical protein
MKREIVLAQWSGITEEGKRIMKEYLEKKKRVRASKEGKDGRQEKRN